MKRQTVKLVSRCVVVVAGLATLAVCMFAGSGSAVAGSASANLNPKANIPAKCTITGGDLQFDDYDPIGVNATAALNNTFNVLSVHCTNGSSYSVDLGNGATWDPVASVRQMASGTNLLVYKLFQTDGVTEWFGGASAVTGTSAGAPQGLQVKGRIPQAQNVPAGSYQDTVVATITF